MSAVSKENLYLKRYAHPKSYLEHEPGQHPGIIVVIPCHDEPNLLASLDALRLCDYPDTEVEVIVVINAGEKHASSVKHNNEETYRNALDWKERHKSSPIHFHFILENELTHKHAGVGLARKIGMDEAVRRFESMDTDGIIVCFDADSLCRPNLLREVFAYFQKHPDSPGCSIHFEHPLDGDEFDEDIYLGITNYELHLRYYVNALRYAGFPHAYQTIGSSMAVRSSSYQKQGGMNRRKAGEDFYFLHRIIPLGHFGELNTTAVIPSPRKSQRVPFGTGKAISTWLEGDRLQYETYDAKTFEDLKCFIQSVPQLYECQMDQVSACLTDLPNSICQFLEIQNFEENLTKIKRNVSSPSSFTKQFFHWFDGFKVLKYVHFARDNFYPNTEVGIASTWLLLQLKLETPSTTKKDLLITLRSFDRSGDGLKFLGSSKP